MSDLIKDKMTQTAPVSAKFLTGFELVKNGSIAAFAFATACVTALGVFLSVTTSNVVFEPLLVPTLFVEQGYSFNHYIVGLFAMRFFIVTSPMANPNNLEWTSSR